MLHKIVVIMMLQAEVNIRYEKSSFNPDNSTCSINYHSFSSIFQATFKFPFIFIYPPIL